MEFANIFQQALDLLENRFLNLEINDSGQFQIFFSFSPNQVRRPQISMTEHFLHSQRRGHVLNMIDIDYFRYNFFQLIDLVVQPTTSKRTHHCE
ncbi:unnamed protein product [Haemonchus placei]|uniref:Uncharacterized protein n=1 Tax=Haemonchus placei TaxID=6290 RepID=A0A0N4WV33_HAEPC|nr:unnamed protein product [Haemonchus placei]